MPEFTFTLNFQVEARDEEHALEIAESMRKTIEQHAEYKLCADIEIDDLEKL